MPKKIADVVCYGFSTDDSAVITGLIAFTQSPDNYSIGGGYRFYLQMGTTNSGGTKFGGFVNPISVEKDDRPDAIAYMTLVPNKTNDKIQFNIILASYDGSFDNSETIGTGVLYKTQVKNTFSGMVFEADEVVDNVPAQKKSKRSPKADDPFAKSGAKRSKKPPAHLADYDYRSDYQDADDDIPF